LCDIRSSVLRNKSSAKNPCLRQATKPLPASLQTHRMDKLTLTLKADKSDVEIHKHSAYQIVFTTDNLFHSTFEGRKHQNIYGFVIKPQVAHSCECSNSNLIIINIEPYSFLGAYILKKLGSSQSQTFYDELQFRFFFNAYNFDFSLANIFGLNQTKESFIKMDKRVENAIDYINKNYKSDKFSINELAKQVFLSSSRLSLLFKQQIGSSIIKYLLWTRLRNAIFLILTNHKKSITEIALECGFYDSSQINKYMYQMFGIAPLKLRQKSDLIQFLEIEPN
jgi:AraC-like DNA-binding protein